MNIKNVSIKVFVDPNSPVFKSVKESADNEDCYYDKNSNRWRDRNAK